MLVDYGRKASLQHLSPIEKFAEPDIGEADVNGGYVR